MLRTVNEPKPRGELSRGRSWVVLALTASTTIAAIAMFIDLGRQLAVVGGSASEAVTILLLAGLWPTGVALVGLVLVFRRPENRVGWLFVVLAPMLVFVLGIWSDQWPLPPEPLFGWLSVVASFFVVAVAGPGVALLFPEGHLPSPRWNRPVTAIAAVYAISVVLSSATPGQLSRLAPPDPAGRPASWATAGIAALEPWAPILDLGTFGGLIGLGVLAIAAVAVRRRGGGAIVRAQLKWFLIAEALVPLGLAIGLVESSSSADGTSLLGGLVLFAGFAGTPIAVGIAILRYHLFDIDVVIRRTAIYAVLVAVLGAVYVSLVLSLQTVLADLTGGETLPVALSTLAVAALIGPVRARVRKLVDRRFYRSSYDAQRTVEAFAGRVRDEVEVDALGAALMDAATTAVHPRSQALWLRTGSGR
jgi:hypothetical protein